MNMESRLLDKKAESVEKLCDIYGLKNKLKICLISHFYFARFYPGMFEEI